MSKLLKVPFSDNFVEYLTDYLIRNHDTSDLSSVAVVFPGIRPSHFLLDSLKKKLPKVFIPPARFSIETWMQYLFGTIREQKIPEGDFDLLYLMYRAIAESGINEKSPLKKITESINTYIHWGSRILGAMEEFEIQYEKQENIEELTDYDENFLEWVRDFWKNFVSIREKFYYLLKSNNLTYRGEVYRFTSENIEEVADLIQFKKIIFAGFYALNKSEKRVMKYFFAQGKADIIIQSDDIKGAVPTTSPYYFHKKWEGDWGVTFSDIDSKNIPKKTQLEIHQCFDTHSEILTAEEILSTFREKNKNTAIILPDSSSLIPLISEIVQTNENDFNITMGYPLKRTALFNLVKYVFSLQKTKKTDKKGNLYYLKDYLNLIQHPWIKTIKTSEGEEPFSTLVNRLEEILISKNRESSRNFFSLAEIKKLIEREEFLPEMLDLLERVHSLSIESLEEIKSLKEGAEKLFDILSFLYENSNIRKHPLNNRFIGTVFEKLEELKKSLFSDVKFGDSLDIITLLENYLLSVRIPFVGEPLKGIQIMGMLESRNLNFEQVILLDVNESIMPGLYKFDPLLPHGLRKLRGLPGYEEEESIYAHNFFRLINGADTVHLIYKEGKLKDVDKNIKSRFIEKIIWEGQKTDTNTIHDNRIFKPSVEVLEKSEIEKSSKVLERLKDTEYSPTKIDTYVRCPLQFYYRYVLGLEEYMDIEEEIERSTIGKLIHDFLKDYYTQFIGKKITIDKTDFSEKLKKYLEKHLHEGGEQILLREIIDNTLKRFIEYESERSVEENIIIRDLEASLNSAFTVKGLKKGPALFKLKGRVDRAEEIGGVFHVIDYKTGTINMPSKRLDGGFELDRDVIKKKVRTLQLPMYVYLYSKANKIPLEKVRAGIFNIRKPREENILKVENIDFFLEALSFILNEIVNPDIPFAPDAGDYCRFCPFSLMCSEG
ncbi:PD-(D/E)XK nuclease family protein [candidate division WOR-3 bacterium]|nr:PD-(D/E)XK nuclease family protein [candidate division WOR-3 bacterium]